MVATPCAASPAVNRQIRAALCSWFASERALCQTSAGKSNKGDSVDSNLPAVTIRSYSPSNRSPRLNFGADRKSVSGVSTPKNAFGKASTMGPLQETHSDRHPRYSRIACTLWLKRVSELIRIRCDSARACSDCEMGHERRRTRKGELLVRLPLGEAAARQAR